MWIYVYFLKGKEFRKHQLFIILTCLFENIQIGHKLNSFLNKNWSILNVYSHESCLAIQIDYVSYKISDHHTLFLIPSDANSAWSLKTEALINWFTFGNLWIEFTFFRLTAKNFRFVEIFVPPIDEAIFVAQKIHSARKRMNGRQQRIPNINIEPGLSFEVSFQFPIKMSDNEMDIVWHFLHIFVDCSDHANNLGIN